VGEPEKSKSHELKAAQKTNLCTVVRALEAINVNAILGDPAVFLSFHSYGAPVLE
jgi:hypothetical protein